MEYKGISCETSNGVLTVTLNRPEKLNAFTWAMSRELIDALRKADEDDSIRVVIITGAGKAFCAGADMDPKDGLFVSAETEAASNANGEEPAGMVTLAIFDMRKPVIAAINGSAIGGGITITLAADVRLASQNAKFGFVFTRVGISSEGASNWFLPRIVGASKAAEWIMTGRTFGADEALAHGLVSEVLPPEALMTRAREIAREIADNTSAVSVALCRQLLWRTMGAVHPMEAHEIESKILFWTLKQDDVQEAMKAFSQKRRPEFRMKLSQNMPDFYPWWTKGK